MAEGGIIKEFLVALGFKTDEASLQKFGDGIQGATQKAGMLALAVTGVAAGISAGLVKVAEASEALGLLSEKSGASVASLEMLGFVSEQFGVSTDTAKASAEGLGKFLKSLPGAEGFLRSVGVATRDANGTLRDTGEMLFDLGDKIKGMPRWRQEAILGRAGVSSDMIRVLTQDVGGLRDTFRQMYSVAGVDAQQAAASSREFMNELRTLKTLLGMLTRAISLTFIDRMRGDMQRFRHTVVENFDKIAKVFRFIIDLVLRVAGFFGAMASRVIKWVAQILGWFDRLSPGTQKLIASVLGLAAAWKVLNLGFLASPIGILFALGLAIAALVDDFQGWKEGADSLIDWAAWEPAINAALDAMHEIGAALAEAGTAVGEFIGPIAERLLPILKDGLGVALQNILDLVRMVAALFRGDFAGALDIARGMLERVMQWGQKLLKLLGDLASMLGGKVWEGLKSLGNDVGDLGGKLAGGAWQGIKNAGTGLADFFGGGDDDNAQRGAPLQVPMPPHAPPVLRLPPTGPALVPSPARTEQLATSHEVTLDQQTTINVYGTDNPEATGSAVAAQQRGVNADLQRNAQAAAR